jgi:hypothetical protein
MSDTIIIAIITASASTLTAISALILNHKLFNSLEQRIERIEIYLKDTGEFLYLKRK